MDIHGNVTQVNNFGWSSSTPTKAARKHCLRSNQPGKCLRRDGVEKRYSSITARGNPTTITDTSENTTIISYDLYGDNVGATINGVAASASVAAQPTSRRRIRSVLEAA